MYALLTFTTLLVSAQAFLFGLPSLFGGGCYPCAQQGYAAQAYQAPAYQAPAYQAYSSYQAPAPAYQAPSYPSYSQQASYGPSGGYAQAPQAYGNAQQYQSFSAPQQSYQPSYGHAAAPQGYQQQAPQHFEAIPESPLPEPVPQQPIVSEGYAQPAAPVYQAPARPTYSSQVSEVDVSFFSQKK